MNAKALILASVAALAVGPAFAADGSTSADSAASTGSAASTSSSAMTSGKAASDTANADSVVTTMKPSSDAAKAAAPDSTAKMPATAAKKMDGAMGRNAPDAREHFKEIAAGKIAPIMAQYGRHATLNWVGGKLDGTYRGDAEIRHVWERFAHDMGKTTETVSDVHVAGDMKGMTVTADVTFKGKMSVPVRYVLVYRNRKIVDEVWQLAPKQHAKM